MRVKFLIAAAAATILGFGISAWAQNVPQPSIQSPVNPLDTIPIVKNGVPTAQQQYVNPPAITSQMGYQKASPATGFTYTFGNTQSLIVLTHAATVASGTIVLAVAPSDGDQNCLYAQNTVTALTVSAPNTTLDNAVTTISAAAQVCYLYSLSTNTWDRSK
jgi:hypothetical protein